MADTLTKTQATFMDLARDRIENARKYSDWLTWTSSVGEEDLYDENEREVFSEWTKSYYSSRPDEAKKEEARFKALREDHITNAHGINRNTLKALEKKGFIQILSMPENDYENGKVVPIWVKVLHF